jgi:alpha-tubulin suppressor-like RCC1 family protein
MSFRYIAGLLGKAPTVVGPVDGEGGTAPGIWTRPDQARFQALGLWPKPVIDRYLWSWGNNQYGRLGLGNITNYSSPKQVGALNTWKTLACGTSWSLTIKSDGTLWVWGDNDIYGMLGLGNTTRYSSPKQVGALTTWSKVAGGKDHSLAIRTDGTLWAWGRNQLGQLGVGDITNRSSPTQVGALTTWSKVSGGIYFTVATKTDGTLWTWGNNASGQLGLGNITNYSSPKQVGALTTWLNISAGGEYFILATKTDGTLWAWGNNFSGQLGLSNVTYFSSPKQVGALTTWSVVAASGARSSAALKTDSTLWTWGDNGGGQLGDFSTTSRSSPGQVSGTWSIISFGRGSTMLGITSSKTLWAWGRNDYGELGLGDIANRSNPTQVGALTTWLNIAGGDTFSIAVKS